jgi:hypothetical protein
MHPENAPPECGAKGNHLCLKIHTHLHPIA